MSKKISFIMSNIFELRRKFLCGFVAFLALANFTNTLWGEVLRSSNGKAEIQEKKIIGKTNLSYTMHDD